MSGRPDIGGALLTKRAGAEGGRGLKDGSYDSARPPSASKRAFWSSERLP